METIDVKTLSESDQRFIDTVGNELMEMFIAMRSCPRSVTFFGAYVFKSGNPYFDQAEKLAEELSALGYTIVTGGGFGIMEAGNKGAANVGKSSLGFNIRLPWRDPAHSWNPSSPTEWISITSSTARSRCTSRPKRMSSSRAASGPSTSSWKSSR